MPTTTETTKIDSERENDVRGSYAKLQDADDRRAGPWGDLQKLAKAFLKWDKTAKAADRRELQNFVSLRLTSENATWPNEQAFRDTFRRVIQSSNQYDPARQDGGTPADAGEVYDNGDGRARSKAVRAAFMAAISQGASDEIISAALKLAKGGKKDKPDGD